LDGVGWEMDKVGVKGRLRLGYHDAICRIKREEDQLWIAVLCRSCVLFIYRSAFYLDKYFVVGEVCVNLRQQSMTANGIAGQSHPLSKRHQIIQFLGPGGHAR